MGPNPRLIDLFIVLQQQGLIARIFFMSKKTQQKRQCLK
jgi:hypothetical protein